MASEPLFVVHCGEQTFKIYRSYPEEGLDNLEAYQKYMRTSVQKGFPEKMAVLFKPMRADDLQEVLELASEEIVNGDQDTRDAAEYYITSMEIIRKCADDIVANCPCSAIRPYMLKWPACLRSHPRHWTNNKLPKPFDFTIAWLPVGEQTHFLYRLWLKTELKFDLRLLEHITLTQREADIQVTALAFVCRRPDSDTGYNRSRPRSSS